MARTFINSTSAFCLLLVLFSCKPNGEGSKTLLPQSSGKYGEVLVVVDTVLENGAVGEELNTIFYKALEGTPQREASFRMSTVQPEAFKSILKRSRNLLKISLKENSSNSIKVDRNVWANDQLMINVNADSEQSVLRILKKNEQNIRDYFNEEELDRLRNQFKKKPSKDLMDEIEKKYRLSILIPPAFVMMENDDNSFWLRKEKQIGEHQIIQGLLYYQSPYTSDSTFSNRYMIQQRDLITKRLVEGSRDSSYMQVYQEYWPSRKEINLNDKYTVEYRGLWNMRNDFMGGPYLHYTWVDESTNTVYNLDAFIFAPKFNKREYLRELEAMMSTAKNL